MASSFSYPAYIKTDDQRDAVDKLRELLPVGATIYTKVLHVSRSGMSRRIGAWVMVDGAPYSIDYLIKRSKLFPGAQNDDGIKVGGCGMDMTFHLVYSVSRMLFNDGHSCTGSNGYTPSGRRSKAPRCTSNDHANDYGTADGGMAGYRTSRHHSDGGYALNRAHL